MSVDDLIRAELESAVSTVPAASPERLDVVEGRGRRRRIVARVGVAASGVAVFMAAVGVTLMVARTDSTPDVTDSTVTSTPATESAVTLGVGHVWPEHPRDLAPVDLGAAFASEILGWDDVSVTSDPDADLTGPVWVTIDHSDTSSELASLDVLTVPVDGGRVAIQIGNGGLSVTSEDTEGPGTVQITPARVPMAVTLEVLVRMEASDELIHLEADAFDLIELGVSTADADTVQTVLVLYRDGEGQVIAAVGGHFTGPDTPETLTTYAIGETVLIKTDCPVADQILRSDIGDGLPKNGQTDKDRVDEVFAKTSQDLVDTYGAVEAQVVPRNGQVWDDPGNGTYPIQDVPDYQIRVTLGPEAPCPQAPQSWNGIPLVFFRE